MRDLSYKDFQHYSTAQKVAEKKVSIVIPIWNTNTELLQPCLESCVNQTMNQRYYEIIMVDDCSTNTDTIEMSKDYAGKYKNLIKYDVLPENGGVSTARNLGIDLAQGEYIYFLDSDDFLGLEALERMYEFGKKNDADIIHGAMKNAGLDRWTPPRVDKNVDSTDFKNIRQSYLSNASKMFKRNKILSTNVRFDAQIRSGQDTVFTIGIAAQSKNISIYNEYTCYNLVGHDGAHLHYTVMSLENYLYYFGTILSPILRSTIYDSEERSYIVASRLWAVFSRFFRDIYTENADLELKREAFRALSDKIEEIIPKYIKQFLLGDNNDDNARRFDAVASKSLELLISKNFEAFEIHQQLIGISRKNERNERNIEFLKEILNLLKEYEHKIIFMFVHKSVVTSSGEIEVANELCSVIRNALGLKTDFLNKNGHAYLAVIQSGKVIKELLSKTVTDMVSYNIEVDDVKYKINSNAIDYQNDKVKSSKFTVVDGEIIHGKHGLNILALDKNSKNIDFAKNFTLLFGRIVITNLL